MNRRQLIHALALLSAGPLANSSVVSLGGNMKRAWVKSPVMIRQGCHLWCWAAAVSMIFGSHRHPVRQERIVESVWGQVTCISSGPVRNIAATLSGRWTDENGGSFSSRITAAYDHWNQINTLSDSFIIDELANNRPLLYCNWSHAMVAVLTEYGETHYGPKPMRVGVLDPYIGQFRDLTTSEANPVYRGGEMTFLAAVDVR